MTVTDSSASGLPAFYHQVETPAFIIEETVLRRSVARAAEVARDAGCQLLYSMKPLTLAASLRWLAPEVSGFAASSPFEAQLAREVLGDRGTVHLTAPGLRADQMDDVGALCDFVAFNSLSQWRRLAPRLAGRCSRGLRVNPRWSRVKDARYDPCRLDSKLGAPIDALAAADRAGELSGLDGLHFHTSCDSDDFGPLAETVCRLESGLAAVLGHVRWINLGGGYLFDRPLGLSSFFGAVATMRERYGLTVFIEPGAALVRAAGSFVATVIDLLPGDSATIAVIDTTVHHMPEVFEYQWSPPVATTNDEGSRYVLAGASCLAGDLFGTYTFPRPLEIGSRVVFVDMGAYSLVKASMFNGINLPAIYTVGERGDLTLLKRFSYRDFLGLNGEDMHATP
jgi:carboxynorspermidine decarboxylase